MPPHGANAGGPFSDGARCGNAPQHAICIKCRVTPSQVCVPCTRYCPHVRSGDTVRDREVLAGLIVSLVSLGLGSAIWLTTGHAWLALLVSAFGAGLSVVRLLRRQASQQDHVDDLANRLDAEMGQHEATRQFIQRLLDVVPMPIYVKDADSRVIIVNRAQAEQWGVATEEVVGTTSFSHVPDPERTRITREEDEAVLRGERVYKEEHAPSDCHGVEQFRVISKDRCVDTQGHPVIVCARFDITRWRQAERELQQALSRERLLRERNQAFIQRVLDVMPDPFYIKDRNGQILMANEALARARGYSTQALIGMSSVDPDASPVLTADTASEDAEVLNGTIINKEQHYFLPRTSEERFRMVSKRPCIDIDGETVIVVAHIDITRWKVAEREVARLAHEDELTGLPNRRRFVTEAQRMMSAAARHGTALSLILLDVDHFKQINDTLGHVTGDQVLIDLAARLREQLRNEDLPCRWGGEEFAVLLPLTDLTRACVIAERLRAAFATAPGMVEGRPIPYTISVGVTQRREGDSLDSLVTRVDNCLYAAKDAGRNCYVSQ